MTVVNFEAIAKALEAKGIPAYVEQTGGGCATIMVGKLTPREEPNYTWKFLNEAGNGPGIDGTKMEDRYDLLVGPGWFDGPGWTEGRGDTDDLYIGPDNDTGNDYTECKGLTQAQVLAEIEKQYRAQRNGHKVMRHSQGWPKTGS